MKSNQELIKLTNKHVAKNYGRYPIGLVRGKGMVVWDASGKKYIDFVAGLAVDNLGHCPPSVVDAIRKQSGKLLHVSNLYHIEPQSQLAAELTRLTFANKFFFCNSGTEANEAAIKLARRWFYDKGQPKRFEIITMNDSFHGRTMASLSATAQKKIHVGFKPLLPGFKYVPFNDITALKKAVTKKTCAVLIEPIQGEGGVNPAQKTYLKTLRKICNEKGILLIFDEIQTGFGRTGPLFAYERYKIKPDIITLAKALGGGIAIGAMGSTNKIIQSFSPGTHGATFGGNPLACAASLASLKTLTKKGFLQKASSQGDYFVKQLHYLKENFSVIREVRGAGLMLAIELNQPGAKIVTACMKEGLLINCIQQNTIRFLPPLIITRKEIDLLIKTLSKIFTKIQQ
ncbi:MAG: aspartate aminotransferase family protein [Nitrospina sp.]|jgi:acetylornithine/N-succinyldiaminopimelate aminotransferase|nr:aspartate aminotransferase family protein [Nitrospina sp.]MBT6295596.1 aspartate aminotransferase family protein [Nitrospina sp.]|tara:strand:+ start:1287 stop:2486 length:1200 start_codon:yes stop_codon:yes gene_type:complete